VQVIGVSRSRSRPSLACVASACLALLGAGTGTAYGQTVPAVGVVGSGGLLTYITPATSANTSTEVVLAKANGSDPQTLGPGGPAVLAPNGKFVAAVTSTAAQASHGSSLILYTVGKKSAPRTLEKTADQLTLVAWSADSSEIAVIDGDALVVVSRGGVARTVSTGPAGTAITGASFEPNSQRLVYALASSLLVGAPVNLYTVAASGGTATEITHDGYSQNPLWGPNGIVFSRATTKDSAYQLWFIEANGHDAEPLTHVAISAPFSGLEPIAFSQNGKHLLANLIGQNTAQAWVVDLSTKHVVARELGAPGAVTIGNAISADGKRILLTNGYSSLSDDDFSGLSVEAVPWSGVSSKLLAAHGAFASWSG